MPKKGVKHVSIIRQQKIDLKKKSIADPNMTHEELKNWFNDKYKLSIERSTVSKIIKKFIINNEEKNLNVKKNRKPKFPHLESALFEWVLRYENVATITDGILLEKAKQFGQKMNIQDHNFTYSSCWLGRFKARYNISLRNKEGESESADLTLINSELPRLKEKIKKYDLNDVFNFDETALFYRLEPDKTLASRRVQGKKKNKERITIGLCTNATGKTKLKPIVIGRYEKPRDFSKINIKNYGIIYKYNLKAWMTGIIFREWLLSLDEKMKKENRNILMIIDNASSHNINRLELKNIEVLFLPPNTTSRIQPMDSGIIKSVKTHYKRFLRYMINEFEKNFFHPKN